MIVSGMGVGRPCRISDVPRRKNLLAASEARLDNLRIMSVPALANAGGTVMKTPSVLLVLAGLSLTIGCTSEVPIDGEDIGTDESAFITGNALTGNAITGNALTGN